LRGKKRRITTPGPGTGSGDNGKKRTTQEFAESHDRRIDPLESLMDAMPSPVFLKDRNGFYIGCNRAFERHAGMSRTEIIGKTVYDVWTRELAEAYSKSDVELLEVPGYRTFEARIDYADGSPRDVVINKATFTDDTGTVAGIVGVMVDVTERKAAERSALEAEKKYRELTEALPQVIFETDVTGTISYVNQAGYDLFGYTEDDIAAGISALNVIDPVDHERVAGAIAKMMDGRSVGALREYLARRKDGSTFPCLVDSTLVADELGEPAGIRGILTDITERRKAEDAMRESEEKHRALFDSSLDGIVFVDTEGRIVDANAAYLDMLGYTREEIREFSYQELTPCVLAPCRRRDGRDADLEARLLRRVRERVHPQRRVGVPDLLKGLAVEGRPGRVCRDVGHHKGHHRAQASRGRAAEDKRGARRLRTHGLARPERPVVRHQGGG